MRQALELSTTVQPRSAAEGANVSEVPPPAEKRARSNPSKHSWVSSWTVSSPSLKGTFLPLDRADANGTTSAAGKLRCSSTLSISRPTAPVAPQTATLGFLLMLPPTS